MKSFAHWAIHRQQKIRIAGRSASEIWGQLIGPDGTQRPFRFSQISSRLTLGEGDAQHVLLLDAYGFEQPLDAASIERPPRSFETSEV